MDMPPMRLRMGRERRFVVNASTEVEALPACSSCGARLEVRPGYDSKLRGNGSTYEQRWCGVWFDHPPVENNGSMHGHTETVLYPSEALLPTLALHKSATTNDRKQRGKK